ncbi:MAG: helix-turn-helix transcriptional regulator [bacterium]|nr:helix-turn-helix transcriptional regulator [bacterium]MDY4099318.1 helix-turn-helix transcriptional regulator [Lachnospiraceae bacterium]
MNQNQRNGAPVLARNCEIGCASFISGDIPRNRSPPGFLEFSFSKFQETGGNDMYYDQKESGKRIAALRKEKGLTQEQLAEKLNISTSTLGKIERGIQGFSIDLLIEIGIFFGISTDYILIGCEIRNYEAAKELDSVINQLVALKMKL